ncbi:MAG: hypothetical protein JOZ80_16590 [Acidobacteriaceae bacterium]|nr:hypothetical protein [Acidobacteriaceae bacterium]
MREGYVGDKACESCHSDKVQSYHGTAHFLTSRPPDQSSILGKFTPDGNVLKTSNPDLFFRMDEKGAEFFQTAVEGTPPYTNSRTEEFGLVIGSGNKGQTYLYWKGDKLFQLPVSYWINVGWVNSPGYRDGVANFERPIIPRCLECHGTYFEALPPPPNRYSMTGFVVGITCEKCHGPGKSHVQHHSSKTAADANSSILNPVHFSRDRQMDLCAWCHAGHGVAVQPWFSYKPGEQLDRYIDLPSPDPNVPIDVHGSQVELLRKSRCFESSTMTCITCHDVHRSQHDLAEFSRRCLTCHTVQSCGMFSKRGQEIAGNCIDCHMLLQETNLIVFEVNGKKVRPRVRNHWIRINSPPPDQK